MMLTSITHRLLLWFVVIALLPLAVFGLLSLSQSSRAMSDEALARMSRLADKKALQIRVYLAERSQNARRIARRKRTEEAISAASHAYRQYRPGSAAYERETRKFNVDFSEYLEESPLFYDVFLITPEGEIVYSYRHEPDFATNLVSGPYQNSQLASAFLESLMTLESSISDFEFYAPSKTSAAFVSAPIFRGGVLRGVIAFQLNTERIYQVAMDQTGLGVTGETLLARMTGPDEAVFVAPLRRDPQAAMQRKINIEKSHLPMNNALAGERGNGIETDYSGTRVVAAWRYLPELRWGMVVKMDADEAFAVIDRQRGFLLEALLALAVLGGSFAFYFGRRMVVSLKTLASTADEIAKGDLNKRVDEARVDEIGVLGRAFNRMAENLQALYSTLEDRIEMRTRELNAINERLRHKQDLLNETQRLGKLGSWELDLVSGELRWTDEIYRIFELTPEEFSPSYENFLSVIHPDDRDKVDQAYRMSLESRQPYGIDHRLRLADGRVKWVREQCTTEFDESGKPLRSVGAVQDITAQKLAEDHLRVAAVAFDTHEAILITDKNANIIRVNQAFQDITGYSAEEVIGKNPRILNSGRQDKAFYTEMWHQLLTTGSWTGELWDKGKSGRIYPKWLTITAVKDNRGATTEYVAIFSDITARKKAEEDIYNLAFYDSLTRLPNRRLLLDRFRSALSLSARTRHYGAVLFLDLDRFKTLNDTLGHDYGDLLLIEVAERIRACVRELDTVARLGGDEFVVLLEEIDQVAEEASQKAAVIAEKIRTVLNAAFELKGVDYHTSPSVGVCLYRGAEESVDDLLKHADMAMYQAKDAGRNAVRFFDPAMQLAVETHAALEADLRRALTGDQLRLYYQIQVDNNNRPSGAEALVRWVHPKRGMIPPAQFIPIAEESSLILDIGQWVLETACRQLDAWSKNRLMRNLTVSVNVSGQQFRLHDFVARVEAVLRRHQVDPSRLKLELTESVILNDVNDVAAKMYALKALGVNLSMDDFGTGYSSLSYLKSLPLDQLKIDQSFVRDIANDPNDAVMVQTIIGMAQNFRLNVIAEGVENEAQLGFLRENGCMAYQGYFFGKPVPAEELEASLRKLRGN